MTPDTRYLARETRRQTFKQRQFINVDEITRTITYSEVTKNP